jgi:hypothetical protein
MDDCPHGQQKRTCEICELAAERDWLRTGFDTYKSVFIETEDRLRAELASVTEERNRLRAVVDAVVDFRRAHDAYEGDDLQPEEEFHLLEVAVAAWDRVTEQLDGSAEATDG